MSYKFKISDIPSEFNNDEVFNSYQFWNYLKRVKLNVFSINIYNADSEFIGYVIITKRKIGILSFYGSPIRGVGADFQGFTFIIDLNVSEKSKILDALIKFIDKSNITPFRILENNLPTEIFNKKDWIIKNSRRYILDLKQTEEEIKKGYSYKSATYEINKAKKRGLYVEFKEDIDIFLQIHFEHLSDVFKRKGIPIPHSKNRLKAMLDSLESNQYLLSVLYNSEGRPIASNTYLIGQKFTYYYTGASLSEYFKDSPNELLMNESIFELKRRGVSLLEFGRGMDYKKKYGPQEIEFIEAFSKKGYWKITLAEKIEKYLKKVRKNKFYKTYLAEKINRILHYSN